MSAAGRGAPRIASDNYPTPSWATRRILEALWPTMTRKASGMRVVEPCAGELAIVHAVEAFDPKASVFACDIRGPMMGDRVGYGDATKFLATHEIFDLLITNPPFDVAPAIIHAQRNTARIQAYLLRASFRLSPWRHDMPDEYMLPQRPSFIASDKCVDGVVDGDMHISCGWARKVELSAPRPKRCPDCDGRVTRSTSDAAEYSWFVWGPERGRSVGRSIVLPDTPLAERKALAA